MGMTIDEIIQGIQIIKAQAEWDYPLDWQIVLDGAIENMRKYQKLEEEPTTKNDLGVDCISRQALYDALYERFHEEDTNNITDVKLGVVRNFVKNFPSVTLQEPIEKCKWIKYDHRTMCPKGHDVDNPYWRIPENRMETLKYCPYCGKEIEVEV